jgi:5-methylcytosine-specific restriction enzyme A
MPSSPPKHQPRLQALRVAKPKEAPRQHDRRLSARERGYTWEWEKARKAWLEKHPDCVDCLEEGIVTSATVVDHIVPHKGDMTLFWDSKNWQSMCTPHHSKKTAREDGGFGNRIIHRG